MKSNHPLYDSIESGESTFSHVEINNREDVFIFDWEYHFLRAAVGVYRARGKSTETHSGRTINEIN